MDSVLYIASSSYSGSTLLSFLLNSHPDITTVGEMEGWEYAPGQRFLCSCGTELAACRFYRHMAESFQRAGLPFSFDRFGTAYRLTESPRLNRALVANLPGLRSSGLERSRDRLLNMVPGIAQRIRRCHEANRIFIRTSLSWSRAKIFVDATKDPYRTRFLVRGGFDVRGVYLVRDPRGVAMSYMEHRDFGADFAAHRWLREQLTILRVMAELPLTVEVRHEDICAHPDETLGKMHLFAGLDPHAVPDDFREVQHHILGNVMRLGAGGRIVAGSRWKTGLSRADRHIIEHRLKSFTRRRPGHRLAAIIRRYLEGE
jgi:hypothetical protein